MVFVLKVCVMLSKIWFWLVLFVGLGSWFVDCLWFSVLWVLCSRVCVVIIWLSVCCCVCVLFRF